MKEAVEVMRKKSKKEKEFGEDLKSGSDGNDRIPDFADMKGQEFVKRAAEIAVAGGHNLLLIGPPGSGKSMTAKCIAGILPPPDEEESLEITRIYSVLGLVDEKSAADWTVRFVKVHHTATGGALIGGGTVPHPGNQSGARRVLFLDELPEFRRNVLEVLAATIGERYVNLSRTYGNYHSRQILCLWQL